MSDHFISREDAGSDLLSAATFLAERITSVDGHADAISAVVPQYLAKGNVDLAAELANSVDDPYTRERLLIAVAEKCAELDDDEYALQLADAVEDPGLRGEAMERVGLRQAQRGKLDSAREMAAKMIHPDAVLGAIAVRQAVDGFEDEALQTICAMDYSLIAVSALHEIAGSMLHDGDPAKAVEFLDRATVEADKIEHDEEKARAFCDLGSAFLDAGRNDRAIETFDKAKATAETIDNMHRDAFLSLAAQGFLRAGSIELADRTLDLVADKTHIASCLLGYAREFWRKDERAEAIEALEEAHAILESQREKETRDHKSRFRLFTQIAAQFAGFEKGERGIEIAEGIKDEGERMSALSQIAAVLTVRKEDEQARQAYRAITEDGDRVFALIGMSDAKENNDEREAALDLLNEAVALAEAVPQLTFRAGAYGEIGKRFYSYGETKTAQTVFEDATITISQVRDESSKAIALASIARTHGETDLTLSDVSSETLSTIVRKTSSQ